MAKKRPDMIGNKYAVGNKGGAPTKYKQEYCQKLIDYFGQEPYEKLELPHYDTNNGKVKWMDYKLVPKKLPTLTEFAKDIGIDPSNVYRWMKKHKEFRNAFTRAKKLRKWALIQNGLMGLYNPAFAKFVATNITDMRDTKNHEVGGRDGKPISAEITHKIDQIYGPKGQDDKTSKGSGSSKRSA